MDFNTNSSLDSILDSLLTPYKERVSDVAIITNAMVKNGLIANENDISNDHIAFRTLGVQNLGIASFEKIFLHYGYQKKDYYFFDDKKLNAYWYAPPADHYPRIFISELRVEDLSVTTQNIIKKYTDPVTEDPINHIDLNNIAEVASFFYNPLWDLPTAEDYSALLNESEYAAWVIYNRYYLNHYTISVHDLPIGYNTIEDFNSFIESLGIKLNTSGGKIKTSPDGLLKQSSTVAKLIKAQFANQVTKDIAGSYVEFAERKPLPEFENMVDGKIERAQRRDGFEAGNADKIFESTYTEQTTLT